MKNSNVVFASIMFMFPIYCTQQANAQKEDKNFAKSCPVFASKIEEYDARFRKVGEMAKEGIQNGNTPAEICKVLNFKSSLLFDVMNDIQTCRPYTTLELNDFATSVSSQLAIAQQQRQGLGCR